MKHLKVLVDELAAKCSIPQLLWQPGVVFIAQKGFAHEEVLKVFVLDSPIPAAVQQRNHAYGLLFPLAYFEQVGLEDFEPDNAFPVR